MCKFVKWIWNLFSIVNFLENCMNLDNTRDDYIKEDLDINKKIYEKEYTCNNFICPICSYNMANTRCYEIGCVNYGQVILN